MEISNTTSNATTGFKTARDKGQLIELTIKFGEAGKRRDKRATQKVAEEYGASEKRVMVQKDMLQSPNLKAAQQVALRLRNKMKHRLMPYGHGGTMYLPNSIEFEVKQGLDEGFSEMDEFMNKHFGQWSLLRQRWLDECGGLDDGTFPSEERARQKYYRSWTVFQVPDVDNVWSGMTGKDAERFAQEVKRSEQERSVHMVKEVASRVERVLSGIVAVGDYTVDTTGKKQNVFKDSRIQHARDLAGLLDEYNITNDPTLEDIRVRMLSEICPVDAGVLRESEGERKRVAASASDMLGRLGMIGRTSD